MKKLFIKLLFASILLVSASCATKGYYVKNGKFHPYNSRGLATQKVKIKYKNTFYYFDTVEEAEHFQTRVKKSKKLKNTLNSVVN
ncbi:hypothetical protein N9N67_04720 [Bacteriovoracaceae bacterium]|nr:hypothetical protein [Bacteriovoracaceae bacterium]